MEGKYQVEISRLQRNGETSNLRVKSLPVKWCGRPLLLGKKLDDKVKCYIQAMQERGGMKTTSITMAAATAIVKRADRNRLAENGGSNSITTNWAKFLLLRLNFVKQSGISTAKMTVKYLAVKEQFLLDIKAVVEMKDIPPELVFNWDQTEISIVQDHHG